MADDIYSQGSEGGRLGGLPIQQPSQRGLITRPAKALGLAHHPAYLGR